MSKITNDCLTPSGTGCFTAVPNPYSNSGRQRVNGGTSCREYWEWWNWTLWTSWVVNMSSAGLGDAVAAQCPVGRWLMMADRGAGDGFNGDDTEEARSPSSLSATGGSDWPLSPMSEDAADDYRRRCLLLEASLIKFKEKATRVRQLFTVKVPHHSVTCRSQHSDRQAVPK